MKKETYARFYANATAKLRLNQKLKKLLIVADKTLVFAFMAGYAAFLLYSFLRYPFDGFLLLNKVGLPALCFAEVSLLRILIQRPRPYEKEGAGIDSIVKKDASRNSMPSRHLASAFVIGMVFLAESLFLGIIALTTAIALAIFRFLEGVHYPSDLIVGEIIGFLFGFSALFL